MAGQPEDVHQIDPSEDIAELCDLCWDDEQKEVPATTVQAGTPLCARHSAHGTKQKRFIEDIEPDDEIPHISIPPRPRRPPDISPEQSKARQNAMKEEPKSIQLFKPGGNEDEFAKGLGSLMQDVIAGRVTPEQADAACSVADRVIRIIEMRIKQDWRENGGGSRLTST